MTRLDPRLIKIFTPSDAGALNTNAQNSTVKEVVARLPEDLFHVTMLCEGEADWRLARRLNTKLVKWTRRGNTLRLLRHCLIPPVDVYFFPRAGPLDRFFFAMRRNLSLSTMLVTYVVMAMDAITGSGLIARSVKDADVVVGNSRYVSQTIQHLFQVSAGTIYDGVDRNFFFSGKDKPKNATLSVLYAGSFQARKRVERVIEQAARLPHVQFRLAGTGETEVHCRNLASKLGCRNATFLGHLPQERLGSEMRAADIFLFPSILEGNPQVLLQAAACGTPAIAMDRYHSDYVVNNETGFLCASDEELVSGLDRLIASSTLRREFSLASVSHAARFDWEAIAGQWAAIFQQAQPKPHPQLHRKVS